jgi:HEAT repeat protein
VVSAEIAGLEETQRWEALAAIRSRAIVQRLPWSAWMESTARPTAGRALAEAVRRTNCRKLLPALRVELAACPQRELVEAVGDLRDSESVPILTALLQHSAPLLRAAVFDTLGRIGGANARALLRSYCSSPGPDAAHACRALAMCATADDCPILRSAADSPDLSVRLAVIGPLVSFGGEENLRVVRRLLFDPSPAVAQKAKCSLDLAWSAV